MKKILVSGGAGYLGSVITGRLLEEGYQVTVLDNLHYRQNSLLGYCSHPNFEFVKGDVRDPATLKSCLAQVDAVIWLAAIVGAGACDLDPQLATSVNLDSVKLLNELRGRDQVVLFPCTNSGYGTTSGTAECTEESPLNPISLYGRTKVQGEQELLEAGNSISLRLATVFGPSPRMRLDLLVNDFVYRAVTDGFLVLYEKDFMRNYVHVEDVSDCFVYCLSNFESMKGEVFNLGLTEANCSKAQLAQLIKKQIPDLYIHYAELGSDPDKRNYIVSNEKLRAKGFAAKRSIELGIIQLQKAIKMLKASEYQNK